MVQKANKIHLTPNTATQNPRCSCWIRRAGPSTHGFAIKDKPNSNAGGGTRSNLSEDHEQMGLSHYYPLESFTENRHISKSYSRVRLELENWQKKISGRKSLLHFSEILVMITAWNLERVLKARWSLAREHYIWHPKQPPLQQLFPVLSINRRPQSKSPNSYPPCPPHLNAHLEDGSESFLLLLPACFFLMQPSHRLSIHFAPPFVKSCKQLAKASYSQGTRQPKVTAYFQNTLQKLMLQFCFPYCASPP